MPYPAVDVAKWFINAVDRESGDSITHLKLQKLLFYTQAWSLALRDEPILNEEFEAWAHGPVVRSVFDQYKDYSWNAIPRVECDDGCEFSDEAIEHFELIQNAYGQLSAKQLEAMTHRERPWREARRGLPPEARCDDVISRETMAVFYRQLLTESMNESEDE